MSEYTEQCALFDFARVFGGRVSELDLLLAIPNGEFATRRRRRGSRPPASKLVCPTFSCRWRARASTGYGSN